MRTEAGGDGGAGTGAVRRATRRGDEVGGEVVEARGGRSPRSGAPSQPAMVPITRVRQLVEAAAADGGGEVGERGERGGARTSRRLSATTRRLDDGPGRRDPSGCGRGTGRTTRRSRPRPRASGTTVASTTASRSSGASTGVELGQQLVAALVDRRSCGPRRPRRPGRWRSPKWYWAAEWLRWPAAALDVAQRDAVDAVLGEQPLGVGHQRHARRLTPRPRPHEGKVSHTDLVVQPPNPGRIDQSVQPTRHQVWVSQAGQRIQWEWERPGSQAEMLRKRMPRSTRVTPGAGGAGGALDDHGADLARAGGVERRPPGLPAAGAELVGGRGRGRGEQGVLAGRVDAATDRPGRRALAEGGVAHADRGTSWAAISR